MGKPYYKMWITKIIMAIPHSMMQLLRIISKLLKFFWNMKILKLMFRKGTIQFLSLWYIGCKVLLIPVRTRMETLHFITELVRRTKKLSSCYWKVTQIQLSEINKANCQAIWLSIQKSFEPYKKLLTIRMKGYHKDRFWTYQNQVFWWKRNQFLKEKRRVWFIRPWTMAKRFKAQFWITRYLFILADEKTISWIWNKKSKCQTHQWSEQGNSCDLHKGSGWNRSRITDIHRRIWHLLAGDVPRKNNG